MKFLCIPSFVLAEQKKATCYLTELPPNMLCIEARVSAILVWRKYEADTAKYDEFKCEQWEVIVPELVFSRLPPAD